jgi:tetratricopeptide (TPR) repeat protein
MQRPNITSLIYLAFLIAGLGALYATGLGNKLVFDDNALTNGVVFDHYGSLLELKVRLLSYGSFVWLQNLVGENWPLQRAFNVLIHLSNALLIGALTHLLLRQTRWNAPIGEAPDLSVRLRASSYLAAAIWAFHPVAVYGVSYLIQRSILMATFFTVLMLICFILGLQRRQPMWHVASAMAFVLALASKEYAISTLLILPVLLVFFRRPNLKALAAITGVALVVMVIAAGLILQTRGNLIGEVFDEISQALAQQLESQRPGISKDLFGLSIINQATLFWRYGMTWIVPLPSFMSIDIRPTFPLHYLSVELVGAMAYLISILFALLVLLRYKGVRALVAVAFLLPALMFATEFATVWVQDPFVLYRSYLWSISLPLALALLMVYLSSKVRIGLTLSGCALLGLLSFQRIDSLFDTRSVWSDAVEKIDLKAPANALGRYRAYLNLGADALDRGNLTQALQWLNTAVALGEPMGSANMNIGVLLQQLSKHNSALEHFEKAEFKGFKEGSLYYHKGESYFAIRDFSKARENFSLALQKNQVPEATLFTRVRRAEAATAAQDPASALADYTFLIAQKPGVQRYRIGQIMSLHGLKRYTEALNEVNLLISQTPSHAAYFARALVHRDLGNKDAMVKDIQSARALDPNNPSYRAIEQQISGVSSR